MGDCNPKELLLYGLKFFDIQIEREDDHTIFTEQNYVIKVEGDRMYRLFANGKEIAPFCNVAELCHFIKTEYAKSRTQYRSPG